MSAPPAKIICRKCRLEYPGDALFCPNCGTARVGDDASDAMVGTTVGDRYVLLERIGHGGSGTIYRSEHVTLRRKVAVKVLHHELSRDDLAIERFRREATTVGQIENDHIVEIFDFGRASDGRLYLAMELLEGETLADLVEREGQLEVSRCVDVLTQLSEALMEAHAMGYIHRDLRPRNVFLAVRRGKGRREFVKLLDFGLAKLVEKEGEAASTSLGMTFGDPHYMSPEQARGDSLDRRADIYSLGCIAYEMLVGEPPFVGGKVFDILTRHVEATPVAPQARRADVPTWLDRAVMRMLAKRADQRFITVFRVIEALRQGSDSGLIMTDDVAQRAETVPPPSVADAIAKLGARAPADMAASAAAELDLPIVDDVPPLAPTVPPPSEERIGGVTALGLGVPLGKRSPQPPARAVHAPAVQAPQAPQAEVPGANGRTRPKNGSGGVSAAWYADGEAMVEDAPAARPAERRPSPSDTGLLIQDDDEYAEPKRRSWRLAALLGGAIVLGAAGIVGIVSARRGSDESGAGTTAVAEEPKTVVPSAVVAADPTPVTTPPAEPAAPPTEPTESEPKAVAIAEAKSAEAKPAETKPAETKVADAVPAEGRKTASRSAEPPSRRASSPRAPRGRFDHIGEDVDGRDAPAATPRAEKPAAADAGKADFYAKLGDRDLASGDLLGAASNFNKARELDPNNATAILGLGEIALSQGATSAALSHLRRAAKLKPASARVHTLLGEALLAGGRRQQAAASFKRALKIDPDDSRARDGLGETRGTEPPAEPAEPPAEPTELE